MLSLYQNWSHHLKSDWAFYFQHSTELDWWRPHCPTGRSCRNWWADWASIPFYIYPVKQPWKGNGTLSLSSILKKWFNRKPCGFILRVESVAMKWMLPYIAPDFSGRISFWWVPVRSGEISRCVLHRLRISYSRWQDAVILWDRRLTLHFLIG